MIQSPIKKYVKLNLGVCETLQVSNTPWSSHVLLQYWFVSIPVGVVTTNAHQQWGSMRLIRMATMSHNVCGCVFSMPKNRRRYLEISEFISNPLLCKNTSSKKRHKKIIQYVPFRFKKLGTFPEFPKKIQIKSRVLWLVVSTPLKNISQNGNLPQVGVKIKNIH